MTKFDFNKVAKQLLHGCFPVNLLDIFRTPFPMNTSGWLLLNIAFHFLAPQAKQSINRQRKYVIVASEPVFFHHYYSPLSNI